MKADTQTRTYKRSESAVFSKTKEAFGGLSNMAAGFPLRVNGVRILTSEALYQACRFPHRPEVQRLIIGEASPMTAKMKSKPYRKDSRPDWEWVRVKIMRWCLRVKLAQNWNEFSRLLLATRDRPIVEESRKDDFWGAKVVDEETLVGMNVLGRLLMELREEVKQSDRERLTRVEPLDIPDFRLYGEPISTIEVRFAKSEPVSRPYKISDSGTGAYGPQVEVRPEQPRTVQASLFDGKTQVEKSTSCGGLIAGLKRYSEYKESGQVWIGAIPKHWNLLPNRAIFAEIKGKNHPDEEMLSVTINGGIIRQKALLEGSSKKDSSNRDKSAYKLVRPQDIAYNKMRAWQGAIGVSDYRGIVSPAYVVMRLRENHNARYFHYLFRTPHFAKEAERWSYGITSDMWSLRPEHFKLIYTPLPSEDEQAAIVRFLDYVNRRIERAIRAKREVIALLNEQKQAIIHRAVTRGLDPAVRLSPSGVTWLGDIPAHWRALKLKHCVTRVEQGWSPQCDAQPAAENEWGVLKVGCVNKDTFNPAQNKKLPAGLTPDPSLEVQDGDILVSRANTRELLGLATLAERPRRKLILCDKLFRFRANPLYFNSLFLVLSLRSEPSRVQIESSTSGASDSMQNIGQGVLKNLVVAVPPVEEQEDIVRYIKEETLPFTNAVLRHEREVVLLREYGTRLIADVVTGKVDVRDAARSLPVENEEPVAASELDEIEEEDMEELASAEGSDE